MSGIMAIVSLDGRPIPPELPRAQLAAIAHRGEWQPRLWECPGIALGHVNLPRTPEAEREVLPSSDPTGRYWITWDGRLDNRDELGPKLGYDVNERTEKTDADYVLDAFVKWADGCVHHLLGDWAIVIWDSHERRLFCAKDPLGWRQLYYTHHDGILAVGSEPQQFFAGSSVEPRSNPSYLANLVAGALQTPGETCWKGVSEVSGGSTLSWQFDSGMQSNHYWRIPRIDRHVRKVAVEEATERFSELFENALTVRLRSNRKVGVNLSGGIDSSYVAAVAASRGARITAATAYAAGTRWMDERAYADAVAEHCGVGKHLHVDVSEGWSLNRTLLPDELFDHPDHPVQSATVLQLASALSRDGVGVVLGGEGADEWHTGDAALAGLLLQRRFRTSIGTIRAARRRGAGIAELARAVGVQFAPAGMRKDRDADSRLGVEIAKGLARKSFDHPVAASVWDSRYWRLNRVWNRYRSDMSGVVSWRDRHACGVLGIEHRTPYNDLRVVEFMANVGDAVKWSDGQPKAVLRSAGRRLLPPSVVHRRGHGIYDELLIAGISDHEHDRAQSALQAAGDAFGFPMTLEWLDSRSAAFPGGLAWRLIAAGMFLSHLDVARPTTRSKSQIVHPQNGKEVIHV